MKVTPFRMQFRKKLVEPSHGFFVLSLIALNTTFQVSQVGLKHEAETVTVKPPICWNYLRDSFGVRLWKKVFAIIPFTVDSKSSGIGAKWT